MDTIIKYCQNSNPDTFNIFLVDNPDDGSLGFSGLSNGRYAFVHPNAHSVGSTIPLYNTISHEPGHALGLRHPYIGSDVQGNVSCVGTSKDLPFIDPLNVMDYCDKPKLRKFQWDILHP
jgi:hypothetical protein